jgi:hypothetical protein
VIVLFEPGVRGILVGEDLEVVDVADFLAGVDVETTCKRAKRDSESLTDLIQLVKE